MDESYEYAIDKRMRKNKRFFFNACLAMLRSAEVTQKFVDEDRNSYSQRCGYDSSKFDFAILIGGHVEKVAEELKMVNEEIAISKSILQNTLNEISSVNKILRPMLKEQTDAVRNARMTAVNEINQALTSLKEIRKFFLESDYKTEMNRLSEFVGMCHEIKKLKDDGTIDSIAEVMLKLSVK